MINSTNYVRKWNTISRIASNKYNAIFHDKRANTLAVDAALNNIITITTTFVRRYRQSIFPKPARRRIPEIRSSARAPLPTRFTCFNRIMEARMIAGFPDSACDCFEW